MTLSATSLARIRAWVGTEVTEDTLGSLWTVLGTEKAVAQAVLGERLADLASAGGSVTIESEYATDPSSALKALQDLLTRLDRQADDLSGPRPLTVAEGGGNAGVLRLTRRGRRR